MDGLFHLHGSDPQGRMDMPANDHSRRRARAPMSFRAAWEPVTAPEFGGVAEPHRLAAVAPAARPMPIAASSLPVEAAIVALPAPAAPHIDIAEVARPVVDAAQAFASHVHVPTGVAGRVVHRLLDMLPFAAALLLITSLVWGAIWLPIPLLIMLLGFDIYWLWRSFNNGIHGYRGYRRMN